MRLLTKDGVAIVEVRDGSLWTRANSVTRCRMSRVQCEAALLFVPYVTLDQLAAIVRGIAKAGENPLAGPETHAGNFMCRKDERALEELARSEGRSAWDYGASTVRRLLAYGFCADTGLMTITDAGRFALDPRAMHYIYAWCEACEAGITPATGDVAKATCMQCQRKAEKSDECRDGKA